MNSPGAVHPAALRKEHDGAPQMARLHNAGIELRSGSDFFSQSTRPRMANTGPWWRRTWGYTRRSSAITTATPAPTTSITTASTPRPRSATAHRRPPSRRSVRAGATEATALGTLCGGTMSRQRRGSEITSSCTPRHSVRACAHYYAKLTNERKLSK